MSKLVRFSSMMEIAVDVVSDRLRNTFKVNVPNHIDVTVCETTLPSLSKEISVPRSFNYVLVR